MIWHIIFLMFLDSAFQGISCEKVKQPFRYTNYTNSIRMASQEYSQDPPSVGYEDVKKIDGANQFLIDVRERDEIRETGSIPNSVNIPLSEIQLALTQLSPESFLKKYGRDKPSPLAYIVFSCRSGKRANMAAQLAAKLGFKDVAYYGGSWLDWDAQTNKKEEKEGASSAAQ
ncbi:rhodanese domain-containing protein CG4456-like isoform X2 [Chrysoperla carnea]|uniref:rhodanese domain-containing protein CG4456-like isoform X2 n=1 Tax=Chrysoperla carnea TaxID=189513 RepID=UPI001D08190B|nr:rhodanese domain-containing protein CG4456-like isoform X2 [Chrysoperla carnea]